MNCKTIPNIGPIKCQDIVNQTPKFKYGPLSIDNNGNVYDSSMKIIGWYRKLPLNNELQVKIYDSYDIFNLELPKK